MLVVVVGIRLLFIGSGFERGRKVGDATHFPGLIVIRLLFGIMAPAALYGSGVVLLSPAAKEDWWVSLILLALVGGVLWQWPEEITADATGVSQKKFFGLGRKQIDWADVDYISDDPTRGVIVDSKLGQQIIHTQLHVGHDDFLEIARQHHSIFGSIS
jgi:hypothetical protein